jgi:hypothetical protein
MLCFSPSPDPLNGNLHFSKISVTDVHIKVEEAPFSTPRAICQYPLSPSVIIELWLVTLVSSQFYIYIPPFHLSETTF